MSPVASTNTAVPPLPADVNDQMRSLKMPHARALAPGLIATARAQRWEPVVDEATCVGVGPFM